MSLTLLLAIALAAPDLRLELERESLTGTHYRYRQYIDGLPVIGGEINVTVRPDGSREETQHVATRVIAPRFVKGDVVWVHANGVARLARRDISAERIRYRDPESGAVLLERQRALRAKEGAVFDPNPVVELNAPELRDLDDSPSAVPSQAYTIVELRDVHDSGALGGPWVQIADLQAPAVPPVDAAGPLIFDRSHDGFEDVNAYFHIDRSQRHLQALGYRGARALVPYAIETDTHAAGGNDNSFFQASPAIAGRGRLFFGEGGTDDAEDSDLVVHEYGHAIHEWISPGTFLGPSGSEGRALSEGFGDYWALSAEYAAALASGRDPFCFADWDARCEGGNCAYPPGADCLRRLDTPKTMADYIRGESPGIEHRNGEIWSAALAEVLVVLSRRHGLEEGRRLSDTLVIESLFATPPNPSFATIARQMLAAEKFVSGGASADVVCAAMVKRGILDNCATMPRGELTYFPGAGGGVTVPDNDRSGITLSSFVSDSRLIEQLLVSVNIEHSGRGELHVSLIAPDGTTVRLANTSGERAPDLYTTFGRDSIPVDSLDVFRGRPAVGEWKLRVADLAFRDVATIVSWSVVVRFQGSDPANERPATAGARQIVPVAGHLPGAFGTFFTTDLQILNPGPREREALLVFTSSASDGRAGFAAVRVVLSAGETVVYRDVVRTLFSAAGIGQLEIGGDVIASARISTTTDDGTFGLHARAMRVDEAIGRGEDPVFIAHLRNDGLFRSNIGFAETSGFPAQAIVEINDRRLTVHVPPFGHRQVAVDVPGEMLLARVSVEGEGRLLAYGATVDNQSGDPIFIPAQDTTRGLIPAISGPGVAGTFWRTDLAISPSADLTYTTAVESVTRRVGTATRIEDAIADLFDRPGTSGTIVNRSDGLVSARIWTEGPQGTYGLHAPLAEPSAAARQHILHVETSPHFRTNVGLLSDIPSRVRVTILDGDGDPIATSEHALVPLQLVQFPILEPVMNGRAEVEVIEGRVYAYGALVDNRTGDPMLVPAQRDP